MPASTSPSQTAAFNPAEHHGDWITTTLSVAAHTGYREFSDLEKLLSWLPILQSVRVDSRAATGDPERVVFVGRHARGTVEYALTYRFEPEQMRIRWTTTPDAQVAVSGWAKFTPLAPTVCLMEYQLYVDRRDLPAWSDPFFENHAPSAVLHHFRDYINRHFH